MDLDRPVFRWAVAVAVAVLALALYLATLAPTVALVDSGELIFAAALFDIPHPPGTPFYVLVGHLFSRLPWGDTPAFRLNLMSAAFAALAAAALFLLALRTFIPPPVAAQAPRNKRRAPSATSGPPTAGLQLAAALSAALTYGASATLWSYATLAEVYTLHTALLALVLLFFLGRMDVRLALLFLGLALAVHHVSALFLVPGALYLVWKSPSHSLKPKDLLFLLPGILTYLYLPIRALQQPLLNWGNPSTIERFFWHVSGKQYRSNFVSDLDTLLSRAWFFAKLAAEEFSVLGLPLILLGLYFLFSRYRKLFVFMALTIGFNLLYALVYDISEDNEAYALPSFLLLGVALAWGLGYLFQALLSLRQRGVAICLTAILCLLPVFSLWSHYNENNHRHYLVAHDYGLNVLENLEHGALLLTLDWQLYSPLLYLQGVERHRSDVVSVDVNLLRRSWYVAYLKRQYPGIMRSAADETEIYLEQLDLFEHDRPYSPNAIQLAFVGLINRIIDGALQQNRTVYATVDLSEEPAIGAAYFRVPVGPVFQLVKAQPSEPAPPGRFRIDSFTDGRLHQDPVMLRVRRNYALMHVNRGIYLTLYGRQSEAQEWYDKGIALDPDVQGMIPRGVR